MKAKIKDASGQIIEGVVEAITDPNDPPAGILTEDAFEERFTGELNRRAKSIEAKAATKLLQDESFRDKALTAWGINLAELQKGGELNAERVAKLKEEWEKAALSPVQAVAEKAQAKLDALLRKKLDSDILAAAREVGIRKEFLQPLTPGADPMIVASLRSQFDYDPEHDDFFEKDPKRPGEFAFSAKPSETQPYRTIAERLRIFAEDKANESYLEKGPQARGPRINTGGNQRGGDVFLTPAQAQDHEAYTRAEAQAKEAGGRVIVQDG